MKVNQFEVSTIEFLIGRQKSKKMYIADLTH